MSAEWESGKLDTLRVMAARMSNGEHVGDNWLYGRNAVKLMKSGLVLQNTMTKYRSALFFALKDAYGETKAREMEKSMLERHADAEALNN